MKPIQGLHHITAVASDPQTNVDFYHHVLGQRLVKTTVNFDDPYTYHLYYGDEIGTPGTIMTFFPWKNMRRGVVGTGETGVVSYGIRPASVGYWQDRLKRFGIVTKTEKARFGAEVIAFADPDGIRLELITSEDPATIQHWSNGPVPAQHSLLGFHSVTLWLQQAGPTGKVLVDQMGYSLDAQEGKRFRYRGASNDRGLYIDIEERPAQPSGRFGAGSIHHIAFRTVDDEEQIGYQTKLYNAGLGVTEVKDRQYFHSIYFREPGGVLFEVATDAPGFLYDEPVEQLGTSLKLPSWYEDRREEIASRLLPIERKSIETFEAEKVRLLNDQ